jgi:hypothetical protein
MPQNNQNMAQQSNATPKHVSFSSLEQWEQMIVFAVLKYLLHTTPGCEHYTTLQERLNDPQLLSKYSTLLDLLKLFPGNFLIDGKGYVSLMDPIKARSQYPTLAAEFERRISAPQQVGGGTVDATSQLTVAFNNATSPWEKALLKTVWTLLMAQTNHAANFPWLTTQLTRFKPWVKQNFGSLRLWAIQQTLFKFQGDTIYVPSHVAPSSSTSAGMNTTTTMGNNASMIGGIGGGGIGGGAGGGGGAGSIASGPPPPAPPPHRPMTANSSFAPVSSANFSIPVPPALPQRRASSNPSNPSNPSYGPSYNPSHNPSNSSYSTTNSVHNPSNPSSQSISAAPNTFQSAWGGDARDHWGFANEEASRPRGRQMGPQNPSSGSNNPGGASGTSVVGSYPPAPPPGHKRQRSASPSSIRQIGLGTLGQSSSSHSSSHHRSQSNAEDIVLPSAAAPLRFGYGPPSSGIGHIGASASANSSGSASSASAAPVNIPKLNFQSPSPVSSSTTTSSSHPFLRKPSLPNEGGVGGGTSPSSNMTSQHQSGGGPMTSSSKEKETVILAAQPLSPRRLTPHPLHTLDKEIPNMSQVPLMVNRASVGVKVVQNVEEVRKVISFLSTFSCISLSVETGEFESLASSQRRSRMSQDIGMVNSPTTENDTMSLSSAKSVRILASSPSGGDSPETSSSSSLIIGSAPSHTTANPLEAQTTAMSQDDMVVRNLSSRNIRSIQNEGVSSSSNSGLGNNVGTGGVGVNGVPSALGNESSLAAGGVGVGGASRSSSDHHHHHHQQQPSDIPIIHEGREDSSYSSTTKDIVIMCLSARTTHGHSPHAPSSTLAGHSDKDLFKSHPVFVFDLRQNPKFYRYIRPLMQSSSTLKVVYNCPSLADLLYTQHGIHLTNIIEIQVLHRLLWEISTLPTRFTHATGLETFSSSDEISKSSDSHSQTKGVSFGGGHAHLSESSGSAKSGGQSKGFTGSNASTTFKSQHLNPTGAPQHHGVANSHHHNPSQYPSQPPIPSMDAPLGQLLQYFGITLGGLPVPEKHPLLDAVESNISGSSIRSALWPPFSVPPSHLLRIIAVSATLLDLRILLATQLSVSFSKTALQLSQGYSHSHLPEFQNPYATGTSLTPMSQDQWIDAPELFSHLNEGHY